MKRSRIDERPQSQELVEALDGIITPHGCHVSYDPALACALRRLKESIISSDEEIMRWSRAIDSGEVPEGTVERSSADKRYMLSLLCVNMGKLEELTPNGGEDVVNLYQEALRWHPDSLEAGFSLGVWLRHTVTARAELDRVQQLWLAAYDRGRAYNFLRRGACSASSAVPYASYNRMIQAREKKVMKELADMLILHFCQEGDLATATVFLKALRYQYKLSQEILCYADSAPDVAMQPSSNSSSRGEAAAQPSVCAFAGGVDGAVPPPLLARLQHAFRPAAPFWSEHSYDFYSNASRSVGYFSYLFPFRDIAPANIVEQTISRLFNIMSDKFPDILSRATIAEWWVHSRPHSCGHQFHFDSDETLIYAGQKAQHPVMTAILYLTPDTGSHRSIGGPTVVTNQTLQSEGLATEGFMFLPKENRMIAFDAKYLHGVVPGRGLCPGPRNSRRVTFMVGFWEKIQSKNRGVDHPGPGQPYPGRHTAEQEGGAVSESKYTWPAEMAPIDFSASQVHESGGDGAVEWVEPVTLARVWEAVASQEGESACALSDQPISAHYNACFQGF